MFSFFKKSKHKEQEELLAHAPKDFSFLRCDMHSHLVPGVDDGAKTIEDSLEMIRGFKERGYSKLITTPHIQMEFYDNNPEKLTYHFNKLKQRVAEEGIDIELGLAAEYYLDNFFMSKVLDDGLLSFGDNYVLVEVSMAGWPRNFSDAIFTIQSKGLKPILAHPERYIFEEDIKVYEGWKAKGMLFQMNMLSITGYYGKSVKDLADRFLAAGLYDFCGTDTHHMRHLGGLSKIAEGHPEIMLRLSQYPHFRNASL